MIWGTWRGAVLTSLAQLRQAVKQRNLGKEIRDYALIIGGVIGFNTAAYGTYYIPSESMVPTFETGDRVVVSKFSYGYGPHNVFGLLPHFPSQSGRLFGSLPERGEVIVFSHPKTGVTTIKRAIGLPGDRIQLVDGHLHINGQPTEREEIDRYRYRNAQGRVVAVTRYLETLPGGAQFHILEETDSGYYDRTPAFVVPEGHVFAMGDNRDNSVDSRDQGRTGYIPAANLIGKAELVAFTFHNCQTQEGLRCPSGRILRPLP